MFEGTFDDWENCFFSFPDDSSEEDKLNQIYKWAKDTGVRLTGKKWIVEINPFKPISRLWFIKH